jgi:mannobiose 2-epimerase
MGRLYNTRVNIIKDHLLYGIIPFWRGLRDDVHGGFYGEMDYDLKLYREADKGGILNSRLLWFFSHAYSITSDREDLSCARHAYEFLRDSLLDKEYGGVYWSVTYDGRPSDDTKHTYCQAFAVYALAAYYDITRSEEALRLAYGLMDIIKEFCRDDIGYLEAFDRSFKPVQNDKLSENGVMASRTMNTLLHVFEAYSEVYRVHKDEAVADELKCMLDIFRDKIYNPEKKRLEVFFDFNMNTIADLHSYGHDIEAAWLIDNGCEILGDLEYTNNISRITKELALHVLQAGFDGTSVYNECFNNVNDTRKVWWVQAEAVLGFMNAYKKTGNEAFREAASNTWEFIEKHIIDTRAGSEWLNETDREGNPLRKEIAGPWKCPYHNGRMCIEIIRRNLNF